MSETRQLVELLCGCRKLGDETVKLCREGKRLCAATDGHDPLDYRNAQWNEYAGHFDRDVNPPVRKLVDHKWLPIDA